MDHKNRVRRDRSPPGKKTEGTFRERENLLPSQTHKTQKGERENKI